MGELVRPRVLVDADAPREEWMAARELSVSASEIWDIAHGTRRSWDRVLDRKLNGSTFSGNRHTARGVQREPLLVEEAILDAPRLLPGLVAAERLEPNGALWENPQHPGHVATPDGFAHGLDAGGSVVVEVKSHGAAWQGQMGVVPPDHRAQMQWQMHVMGAAYALYRAEVVDDDGERIRAGTVRVDRDPDYIAFLVRRADEFIAWREAGAPEADVLAQEQRDALRTWLIAVDEAKEARKAEEWAKKRLMRLLMDVPGARAYGASWQAEDGGVQLIIPTVERVDEELLDAEARSYYRAMRRQWEEAQRMARRQATVQLPGSPRLRVVAGREER